MAAGQMSVFPGGTPTAASLDRVVAPSPGVPAEPRRARRVGQLGGAAPRGHRPATRPTPPTAASSATPTANPTGTLHEGAMSLVNRHSARDRASRRSPRRCCSASSTCTPTGSPPGRTRSSATTATRAIPVPPTSPPRHPERSDRVAWSARSGGTARRASTRSIRSSSGANATAAAASPPRASRSCKTAWPRTSPRRCSSRTATGTGTSPTTRASRSSTRLLNEAVPRLDALGFQLHFHAIGDRAVRECLDAVQHAIAGERPQRQPPPHRAHPGRASRRHRALPRARRRGEHAVALGGARTADGRAHASVPRRAA